jgi:hypothetical protein
VTTVGELAKHQARYGGTRVEYLTYEVPEGLVFP